MPCGRLGDGGACAPFASPPLGSGTASIHRTLGILRSEFLGARYALWSLRGGGGGMCPFCPPPLGSGTASIHGTLGILRSEFKI